MGADGDVQRILEIPLPELTTFQVCKLLEHLLKSNWDLAGAHLELAIQHHRFKLAIQIVDRGITCPNLVALLTAIFASPRALDSDFAMFLLACIVANVDLSDFLLTTSSFSEAQIAHLMIVLIPLLIASAEFVPASASLDLPLLRPVFDAYSEGGIAFLSLAYVRQDICEVLTRIADTKVAKLDSLLPVLSSEPVAVRVHEFANAITNLSKDSFTVSTPEGLKQYRASFCEEIDAAQKYVAELLQPPMQCLNSTIAEGKAVSAKLAKYVQCATFVRTNFLDAPGEVTGRLKAICIEYTTQAFNPKTFNSALPSIQFLAALVALARREDPGDLVSAFGESIADLDAKIPAQLGIWERVMVGPLQVAAVVGGTSHPMFQAMRHLADSLLLNLYFSEAADLDAIVREEAIVHAAASSFFPKECAQIFKSKIPKTAPAQAMLWRHKRDKLFQFLSSRISDFYQKTRAIPGARKDLKYDNFVPERKWVWPVIANCQFPTTPQEIREVLGLRENIRGFLEDYVVAQSTEMCRSCHVAIALVVCPRCRRLVLCNKCKGVLKKCPNEGCDFTFE
jgi:hypothetical protein